MTNSLLTPALHLPYSAAYRGTANIMTVQAYVKAGRENGELVVFGRSCVEATDEYVDGVVTVAEDFSSPIALVDVAAEVAATFRKCAELRNVSLRVLQ